MTLRKLIEVVEAGEWPDGLVIPAPFTGTPQTGYAVTEAFHGSLDAAKALHDALLPRWRFVLRNTTQQDVDRGECKEGDKGFANVWPRESPNDGGAYFHAFADTAARAWLLAILRALEGTTQ